MFHYAVSNFAGKKLAIIIDEAHELWPASTSGAFWHLIESTKNHVADFRKRHISLVLTSHSASELDWRIVSKLDYHIYAPGSRPVRGSLIKPRYTVLAPRGVAYVEQNKFGTFSFKYLPGDELWLARLRKKKGGGGDD